MSHQEALRTGLRLFAPFTVFALRDGALVPRHGERHPGDPLADLTPRRWLEQLAKSDAYLFAELGRAH